MDNSVFMRHGDIDEVDFKVRIDFLRDFKNKLGLLTEEDEVTFREQLERDTNRQTIAKLATSKFMAGGERALAKLQEMSQGRHAANDTMMQAAESAAAELSVTHSLEEFCFQIYIEVELIHSDD